MSDDNGLARHGFRIEGFVVEGWPEGARYLSDMLRPAAVLGMRVPR